MFRFNHVEASRTLFRLTYLNPLPCKVFTVNRTTSVYYETINFFLTLDSAIYNAAALIENTKEKGLYIRINIVYFSLNQNRIEEIHKDINLYGGRMVI